jgi:hypothetical protein
MSGLDPGQPRRAVPKPPRHTHANRAPREYRRRVDPKRISLALVGFVLSCIATAMTLPAFVWLIAGGPGRQIEVPGVCLGQMRCTARADSLLSPLAAGLVWLSVPLGSVALAILVWAATRRSEGRKEIKLVRFGIVVAIVGTLIVAYMAVTVKFVVEDAAAAK